MRVPPGARHGRLRAVRARRTAYDRVRTACKSLSPCVPATASHEDAATSTGAPHFPPAPCRACAPDPHADGPHHERLDRLWTGGASSGAVLAALPIVPSTAQCACVSARWEGRGWGSPGAAMPRHCVSAVVRGVCSTCCNAAHLHKHEHEHGRARARTHGHLFASLHVFMSSIHPSCMSSIHPHSG